MGDHGLVRGNAGLRSVGPITFGPDDVLFVADNRSAAVVAIDVAEEGAVSEVVAFDLDAIDGRLAAYLGCPTTEVVIRDLAVHPTTHAIFLSVMRGRGDSAIPLIIRVDRGDATLSEVDVTDIACARVDISGAPAVDDPRTDLRLDEPDGTELEVNQLEIMGRTLQVVKFPARAATVTDLAYVDGTLLVAGMSNEEFSSTLRRIPFPFTGESVDNNLEIFHVSHGLWETAAPIRTFVPYEGGRSILASYTCTPLVHFPLADLAGGSQARGRTVAELGPMNQPLDMISFTRPDGEHLLIAHSSHPLMTIACADIDGQAALTEPREPVGVPRTEHDLAGIQRLATFGDEHVLVLQVTPTGERNLRSLKTASL
jgi:hypothetical protein